MAAVGVQASNSDSDAGPSASPPSSIITIGPNAAEIICGLGACDSIVGVDKFCVFPPALADVPRVGGLFDPDLERIVSLRPDLIVLRGRSATVERLAERMNIGVYHDPTERLDQIPVVIGTLGDRLGRQEQARAMIEEFESALDRVRRRVAGRARPRVFLSVARQPDRLADVLTAGQGVFLTQMIEIAGGQNVFGDVEMGYPQVSIESILARRPDVIIELMPEVEVTPELRDRILTDWRRWALLPAVAQDRVHIISDDHCLIPSPRYVDIIERVSRILHPDEHVEPKTASSDAD